MGFARRGGPDVVSADEVDLEAPGFTFRTEGTGSGSHPDIPDVIVSEQSPRREEDAVRMSWGDRLRESLGEPQRFERSTRPLNVICVPCDRLGQTHSEFLFRAPRHSVRHVFHP